MLRRNARRLGLIALMLGLVLAVRVWFDHRSRDDDVPPVSTADATRVAPAPEVSDVAGSRTPSHGATGAPETSTQLSEAHLRLEVRAPPDVRVGEVFQVRVEINANAAVHELLFLVGYPALRLKLVGWSRGNFTEQRDLPADFGAEEPSDGNIQITYAAKNGLSAAGAGSIVVFEFEATAPGTAALTLQNVNASGVAGDMPPKTFAVHEAEVAIR